MSPRTADRGRDPQAGVRLILLVGIAGVALIALVWWQWPGPLALIAALVGSVSATAAALWGSAHSPHPSTTDARTPGRSAQPAARTDAPEPVPEPSPAPEAPAAPEAPEPNPEFYPLPANWRLTGPEPDMVPGQPAADADPDRSRPDESDAGARPDAATNAVAPPAWAGGLEQALGVHGPDAADPEPDGPDPEPDGPDPEPDGPDPEPDGPDPEPDGPDPTAQRAVTSEPEAPEAEPGHPTTGSPAPFGIDTTPRTHRLLRCPPAAAAALDPSALGLTTRVLVDAARPGLPPYVPRDLDPGLDAALSTQLLAPSGGFVALQGQTASGLTRTAFEALRRTAPHRPVLAVTAPGDGADMPLPELLAEVRAGAFEELAQPVVLVDDAHRHLGRGLTRSVVLDLSDALTGCTIVLTLDARRLQLPELVPDPTVGWLRRYIHPDLLGPELSDTELTRAFERFPARSLDGRLRWLPAWCSGADLLRTRFREWRTSHPVRAAVLTAAAAWQLATDEPDVSDDQLRALTRSALDGLGPDLEVSDAEVDAHLEVLTDRSVDGPGAGPGDPEAAQAPALVVVDPAEPPTNRRYRTDRVLVEELAADPSRLTPSLWAAVVKAAGTARGAQVAQVAAAAGEEQLAADALELALEDPDPAAAARAAYALGLVLDRQQQPETAAAAYRRAVAGTDHDAAALAAFHLGGVLEALGQTTAAVDAYAIAIASGHRDAAPLAAFNLGWRHEQDRRTDEACAAYEQALASDHPDAAPMAAFNLAWVRQQQRRNVEAEQLYREAMASEHPDIAPMAGVSLGILLERLQRVREARTLFERIAAGAHDEAAQAARLRLQTTRRSATRRRR